MKKLILFQITFPRLVAVILLICFLLLSSAVFYHVVIWIPYKQQHLENYLSSCLGYSAKYYEQLKVNTCKKLGHGQNCTLTKDEAQEINNWKDESHRACFQVLEKLK